VDERRLTGPWAVESEGGAVPHGGANGQRGGPGSRPVGDSVGGAVWPRGLTEQGRGKGADGGPCPQCWAAALADR
jgi:hypothetical protein